VVCFGTSVIWHGLASKITSFQDQPGGSIKSISAVAHAAAGNDDHIALAPESRRQGNQFTTLGTEWADKGNPIKFGR